jgi:MFS family permease
MTQQDNQTPPSQGPSGHFLSVFPMVALPMVLALTDQSIVATALPAIGADLGRVEQISLVVVGYLIATTIIAPVYGFLGDLWGRRKLLVYAMLIFLGASLICALSVNLTMLVAGRILQGVGGGGLMALSQALIGETVAPRDRARYQGYLATVGVTSNALGPVLGGLLTEHFGWRSIFLYSLPLGLLAIVLILRLPRRAKRPEPVKFDYRGLALFGMFVVSMLSLLDLLRQFDTSQLPLMTVLLLLAIASFVLLLRAEGRTEHPLLPLDLLRDPTIWRANAMGACHGGLIVSLLTFVPIYLTVVHGVSPAEIGLLMAPITVGFAVGSILTGQVVSRTGVTAILPSVGMTIGALGLVVLSFVMPRLSAFELALWLSAITVCMGTVMSVVQVSVQVTAGQARIGAAAAAVQYTRSLGAALGTAACSSVLFLTMSLLTPDSGALFAAALAGEPTPPHAAAVFETAFRATFLAIAAMAALSAFFAWTMPTRRI